MTNTQIQPDVDLRREQLERQRVTYRTKLTPFALAAAIALATVACDGGDGGSGARPNEAAPADESPTMVPETPSGPSFLDPLTDEQAAAMVVMVIRALGLPARIAVGFRTGTQHEDGSYLVQTDDAHVWVEVLFPGYGWLQFEPETGTTHPNAQAGTYLNPVAAT